MSTRTRKNLDGPISQSRYMSSHELVATRGISAVATSAKASMMMSRAKKELIWFIQGISLVEGGLRRMARKIEETGATLPYDYKAAGFGGTSMEQFLIDLCINPETFFVLPGEDADMTEVEAESILDRHPEIDRSSVKSRPLNFQSIIKAICNYAAEYQSEIRSRFFLTSIGKKSWQILDRALSTRRMVLLDGLEGRGKTQAVKAWCDLHLGSARFVTLNGITNKTTAFRSIAKALGVASTYTRTAPEMQARIEDVLQRSKLLLVIDEAHFAFNQSRRMYSRPEIIDWIDTALCNHGVPVALVTTPQFVERMTQAFLQVDWNYKQFRRRVGTWEVLPKKNTDEDVRGVIQHVFPNASARVVEEVSSYVTISERDLSAIGDVADELRELSGTEDMSKVTGAQIRAAIDRLLIGDLNFKRGMDAARGKFGKPGRRRNAPPQIDTASHLPEEPSAGTRNNAPAMGNFSREIKPVLSTA